MSDSKQPPAGASSQDLLVRRLAFERWITAPPFERSAARYPDNEQVSSWPGQYRDIAVEIAWGAWCESSNAPGEPRRTDQ